MLRTDLEVMALRVGALWTHDGRGRLMSVNEPDGGDQPAPRFYLGRTPAGNLWRFRADLPDELVAALETLCQDEPAGQALVGQPRHAAGYRRLLRAHTPLRNVWSGPAYRFPAGLAPSRSLTAITAANAGLLRGGFEKLLSEVADWQPFLAVVEDGRAVSVCRSVRITPAAHEAGVETLPDYRGRGFAAGVVAGWARRVRALDAVPLYSTTWANVASQAVARKLRLIPFGADFHIT